MPGVLIVEALAQTGAVAALSAEQFHGKLGLFAGIDGVRFRRQVIPGDQLRLEVTLDRIRGPVGKATATATVGRRSRRLRHAHVCNGRSASRLRVWLNS